MRPSIDSVGKTLLAARSRHLHESWQTHETPEAEVQAEICACIGRLATTLKPEYSDALQAVDVQGLTVKAFATARGLSASNAGVRVFRAREALKKRVTESCGTCAEHGCRDCTCRMG